MNKEQKSTKEKFRFWWIENQGWIITTFFIVSLICLLGREVIRGNGLLSSSQTYPKNMDCRPIDIYGRYPVCEPE